VESAKGIKMIIVDAVPLAWFAAGKSVTLFLQAKDREDTRSPTESTPPPRRAPAPQAEPQDIDDDLPF